MNNRKLAFLLKLFVFILAAMGLVVFALAIPELLHSLIEFYGRTFNEELPLQLLSASAAFLLCGKRGWLTLDLPPGSV